MSKRRRSKKPNLPKATLDRARRELGGDGDETAEEPKQPMNQEAAEEAPKSETAVVERAARRRKISPVQLERIQKSGEVDMELIEDLLANPTKIVSEAELQEEYGHVLADLRNMGILAGILMVALVALAQLI